MNNVVAEALNLVYKFVTPLCNKQNQAIIEQGLLSLAGVDSFDFSGQLFLFGSYEQIQSTLARLNERESIRRNKGVYYTPTDVVNFIIANTIKASLGVLSSENIQSINLSSIDVKDVTISNSDFNSAEVGGLYSYYKPVLQQARAIWGFKFQSYSDVPAEAEEKPVYTIPYVINMETLFEYYARTVLKRTFSEECYRVEKYSKKLFLQKDVNAPESAERGIHLMPFCIPDIIILQNEMPAIVIDAKYKVSGRPDRGDSHQLLAYVLLTGANRCAFILPNTETKIREMETTGDQFLTLSSQNIRYYEMLLGHDYDPAALKSVLM